MNMMQLANMMDSQNGGYAGMMGSQMMGGAGQMMGSWLWGGWISLILIWAILILGIAALIKWLIKK